MLANENNALITEVVVFGPIFVLERPEISLRARRALLQTPIIMRIFISSVDPSFVKDLAITVRETPEVCVTLHKVKASTFFFVRSVYTQLCYGICRG